MSASEIQTAKALAELASPAATLDEAWSQYSLPWNFFPPQGLWDHPGIHDRNIKVTQSDEVFAAEIARQIVLVRTTWRRNFSGLPFFVSASADQLQAISQRSREWAFHHDYSSIIRLAELSTRRLGLYRERLILPWQPTTLPQVKPYKAIALSPQFVPSPNTCFSAVRLGEVEHLQVVQWESGWQSHLAPSQLATVFGMPDARFALSPTHGYLMSDPTWAGPGMQVEVVAHLPALMAHRKIQQAQEGLQALGLSMHPETLGTVSGQDSGFFRISSRGGLGLTARQLRENFWQRLKPLLEWERQTRLEWWQRDPLTLRDRMHRSMRMLGDAQLLPWHEALIFTAFVRLGAVLGEFEPEWLLRSEKVRIWAQSAHLGVPVPVDGNRGTWQRQEDALRAEKVRSWWKRAE